MKEKKLTYFLLFSLAVVSTTLLSQSSSVKKTLYAKGVESFGEKDYFSAAQYYFQSNLDMTKALTYVNKALEMNADKPFWFNRLKSLIQAKLGDKTGAIATAKLSMANAEKAKNADYVKMNTDSIKEWSKK